MERQALFPTTSAKVIYANGTEKYFTFYMEILCRKFAFWWNYDRNAEIVFVFSTYWEDCQLKLLWKLSVSLCVSDIFSLEVPLPEIEIANIRREFLGLVDWKGVDLVAFCANQILQRFAKKVFEFERRLAKIVWTLMYL